MNMTLRMAIDLYNDLKKIALEEERSINGEICYILKKYIEYVLLSPIIFIYIF